MTEIRIHAPDAEQVWVVVDGVDRPLTPVGPEWRGSVPDGTRYGIRAAGDPARRFDPSRVLIDPRATAVWFGEEHERDRARPRRRPAAAAQALAVSAPWPARRPPRPTTRPLVVYEAHVRGLTMRRERPDRGTFAAAIDELDRLAALGVSVLELLPVHAFDPDEVNYWGYMPVVFGAIHGPYGSSEVAAAGELAELVAAAHERDIEVWLDVVFNHTTEEDEDGPLYNLRGLADGDYYVLHTDRSYVNEAGTGNIIDATSAAAQALIMEALDRLADLGIDGFRFDLAGVLARDPGLVRHIGDWAISRGVRVVAEPWDLARYLLGRSFPDPRWMQWNDRFRDDMRGFLRGEPGLVAAVMHRLEGSPDLFDEPMRSVNFLTAHDGFTMYDLVAYEHKHNEANGWHNTDGTDHHRSWNGGWEGDHGVPPRVLDVRRRQMRNAMCLLLLSHGVPMFVAGDEFGRTQHGNNNPYNQDNETSWIDWCRRDEFLAHEAFVACLLAFRAAHPIVSSEPSWWGDRVEWFGVSGPPDTSGTSRTLAWHLPGLYVMANMWWEPLDFEVQVPGHWCRSIDTAEPSGFVEPSEPSEWSESAIAGPRIRVHGRSIVVLIPAR
ncbi:MAG: alpha-amylase family glycosyl hydrolase [Ilumatobacteraceae bacterium]